MKHTKFQPRKFIINANIEYLNDAPYDTTDYKFTCEFVILDGKLPEDEYSRYFFKKDANFSNTEYTIILMYIFEFGIYKEILCDDLSQYDIKFEDFDPFEDVEIIEGLKKYFE